MGAKRREQLPIEMVVAIIILALIVLIGISIVFSAVYKVGIAAGYKECLDDARLGKPPRYELVEVSKKWVRK